MSRKRIDIEATVNPSDLPEHIHAHVKRISAQKVRPDMVVTVVEFDLIGGQVDGKLVRIALCPHCLLKIAQCTDQLAKEFPECFEE